MRIACIDETASDRVELQVLFQSSYESCRNAVGHLSTADPYPASKEEVLINLVPDVVAIGPAFSLDEAYLVCRDVRAVHPDVPIFVFVQSNVFSLRSLRRFEGICDEVFSVSEEAIRIVHKLSTIQASRKFKTESKIVCVSGVKGGVGATSITSGLAHAAEAIGKTAVVVDLSLNGVFSCYMGSERWHSSDLSAALIDGIVPDKELVSRCLTITPNGITCLLPPTGGSEVRELWLRDSKGFEISASCIEILTEMYDVVLVDIAGAEGVLPFALNCRAYARLLVTSNDPASVHLLNTVLSSLIDAPGEGQIHVLVNLLQERGLHHEDVLDFLHYNPDFDPDLVTTNSIPFDSKSRNWIGTGNSFYTEGALGTQKVLEDVLAELLLSERELERRKYERKSLLSEIIGRISFSKLCRPVVEKQKALPLLRSVEELDRVESLLRPQNQASAAVQFDAPVVVPSASVPGVAESRPEIEECNDEVLYEPPKIQANSK